MATVRASIDIHGVVVVVMVVLPVGSESMPCANMVAASALVATAQVPMTEMVVHLHATLDGTLQLGVHSLVAPQLLHNHDLWLLNNHALSWLSLHGHHTWLHLHLHRSHARLTLHLHRRHARLTLHHHWLRRHVGDWIAVRANHLTTLANYRW